jgi:predicted glycoside hydrolase/deacetylase ChbG (UPF0249 family)
VKCFPGGVTVERIVRAQALLAVVTVLSGTTVRAGEPTVAERLGYPKNARLLLIHADDYGAMHSVNRATEEALENGWVTSASVIVPSAWFPEVVRFAKSHPKADLGVHLALNSEWKTYRWGPVSSRSAVPSLLDPDGYLFADEDPVLAQAKLPEVEREFRAQIDRAREAGLRVTHLDTHCNTIFRSAKIWETYFRVGREYAIPVLQEERPNFPGVVPHEAALLVDKVVQMKAGAVPGQWLQTYEKMLEELPPGVFQLLVHLGYDDDEQRGAMLGNVDWGSAWRQRDFDTMKSPEFRKFLKDQGFILVGWSELAKALPVKK